MERMHYLTLPPNKIFEKFVLIANELIEENVRKNEIVDPKRIYQHELFIKYVFHINTLLSIINGTNISLKTTSVKYIDYPSIITLIRASLETYLTYYFIFVNPKNDDERIFRYHNWFMDGLNQRQKMEVGFNDTLKEKQRAEMETIKDCLIKVKSTQEYLKLSEKQQNKIAKDKIFIRPVWSEICNCTGLNKYWAQTFYSYFCSYAHSTSSCIIQFETARQDPNSVNILVTCEHFILIITAMFINQYCKDFKVGEEMTGQDIENIEAWTYLGKSLEKPKI